jgi:hypothetical protein
VLSINHKEILIQAVEIDDNIFIYTQEQIEKYNNAYYSLTEEQQRDYISYLDEKEDPKYIDESRILNYKNI